MSPSIAVVVLWLCVLALVPLIASLHIHQLSVIRSFPHDPLAFTEGLCFAPISSASSTDSPLLLESTGIWRASTVRTTDMHTGKILRELRLTEGEFGEGIAVVGVGDEQKIVQLTYQNGTAYEYQLSALLNSSDEFSTSAVNERVSEYSYPPFVKEGWGVASWPGTGLLYMSDGTNTLHVLHAGNFSYIRSLPIHLTRTIDQSTTAQSAISPLSFNELELLSFDLLLANLYPTRCMALINVTSARLLSVIRADGDGVPMYRSKFPALEVMNGIAYRPSHGSTADTLLVTGKMWPAVYQVTVAETSEHTLQQTEALSEEEQLRVACPLPSWSAAEAEHAKLLIAAIQYK